jgi:antitoxin component of MazEF toxin-antitoxin module
MRVDLIPIGDSQGICLPQSVIEQAHLTDELHLEVSEGTITIRSCVPVRKGWQEAAKACHEAGDDSLEEWDAATSDFDGEWK